MDLTKYVAAALTILGFSGVLAQELPPAPKPKLKDEMRMPWKRGDQSFLRLWLVAGPFPGDLETDCLSAQGGEANLQPTDGLEQKREDGTSVRWHSQKSWSDVVAFDDLAGPKDGTVAYAFTRVSRPKAGKALVSVGSGDGIRVWLNGRLPGATTDFMVTPFAIVIGAASRDPEMVAICSQKAGVFAR